MKKVIVIVGPTGIGKTKISIQIAKRFNLDIISGDSVAVYKSLDIGSAKPSLLEQEGITHHLIDILEPNDQFDVATFQRMSREIIDKNEVSLICGGTGLYISSVLYDYNFEGAKRNDYFMEKYENFTNEELYKLLLTLDPNIDKEKIHQNNRKRVLRALEVLDSTDNSIQSYDNKQQALYDSYIIYLNVTNREVLYNRINKRVDMMLKQGLLKEVEDLYNKNIIPNAIGYKEFEPYFKGSISLEEAIEKVKQNTRHLAKRQMTWFKNQFKTNFYEVDFDNMNNTVELIVNDIDLFMKGEI